jgi:hypothetical protein
MFELNLISHFLTYLLFIFIMSKIKPLFNYIYDRVFTFTTYKWGIVYMMC